MRSRLAAAILLALACHAQQPPVEEAVAPNYPQAALTARAAGTVTVEVRVSERGAVTSAGAIEGDALLRQASVDAARLWRFHPAAAGHSIKLTFQYRLMPRDTPEAQLGAVFRPPYSIEVRRISPEPVRHYARNAPPADGIRPD